MLVILLNNLPSKKSKLKIKNILPLESPKE